MSDRLPDLFARALELDGLARRALLDEVRSEEPALAGELELLLAAELGSPSLLDRSPWSGDAESLNEKTALPESVGPYRILRELGRGGMGRVFLAEEETEDFKRIVALKVIDRPAFDDEALRRFRDEVRILSSLEHPGIARFLHGGRAGDGTWFLALEYVDGQDLITSARERGLPVRERLQLFVAALDAVRFAHACGVVHRDLKPSHILIDREGRPRLLDFGISKLVDPQTHQSLALTRTESRALTPAYASPEQFRGEPVTPASDVYSLGTILYELLAGRRPFAEDQGSAVALERAVLETDPEPPSTAARRLAQGPSASEPAAPRVLRLHGLDRDVDEICLKSLRKAPLERYADAGALEADLRRYLAGETVEARRGGGRYRLARSVRRHRAPLAVGAALAVAAIALGLAIGARRNPSGPLTAEPAPRPFPYSNVESLPIEELRRAFAESPASVEAGATLALRLAKEPSFEEARLILARVRQIPGEELHPLIDYVDGVLAMDLEEPQRALVLFTRARDQAITRGFGELVAQIRASRGRLLATMGQREQARAEMELALKGFEAASDHASLSRVLNDLAIEDLQKGNLAAGQALLERAIGEARAAGADPGIMLGNLANLEIFRGRPDRAEAAARELVESRRASGNRRQLGEGLALLGDALQELGRPVEAEAASEEAISLLRETSHLFWLQVALYGRAAGDIRAARFDRLEGIVAELESAGMSAGGYLSLSSAHFLRALAAGARGELAVMRRAHATARTLRVQNGDLDQVATGDAIEAQMELRAGNRAEAHQALARAEAHASASAADGEPAFLAAVLRTTLDAREAKAAGARLGLEKAGESSARSPSVGRRIAYLEARAALAASERRFDAAKTDLQNAIEVAHQAARKVDELELRLVLAELLFEAREGSATPGSASSIAAEAEALGLQGVATRARLVEKRLTARNG